MSTAQNLLAELRREGLNTRKILERIPEEQFDWRPHQKSMPVLRLATHVAELPGLFVTRNLQTEKLDFAASNYKRPDLTTSAQLLQFFDDTLQKATEALEKASEEDLNKPWTLQNGEKVFFTLPRKAVIRTLALNHLIHHRGQLSVYLRMLDIPVPGMYGPSADESF